MSAIRALRAAAAACALMLAAGSALAADAPPSARRIELASQVFAASHMERTMEAVTQAMGPTMTKQFEIMAPQLTPEQRQAINAATTDLMTEMTTMLLAEMVPVYASTFSEPELTDLLAFYRSPTGQSMIDKTPQVMARLQPTIIAIMPEMMTKMRTRLCAELGCPAQAAK